MKRYQRPKGTADIVPGESEKWQYVEAKAREVFAHYRYHEIRTPIFENYDVFARTSGDTSDIVTKEMYDFHDKGDRHVALRPEGTAGVVRAFIENKFFGPEVPKPFKVFYMGPMFRYERPQSGRMRQFHQIGVEAFGSDAPALDVEVIAMAVDYLKQLGLTDVKVTINSFGDAESRAAYRQALLDYLEPLAEQLSPDSQTRLHKNPLRILDSKDDQDQDIIAHAPSILDYLTPAATEHLTVVKQLLDQLGIEYVVDSEMVRGLDYYNHTIFEIMSNSQAFGGKWTTVCAGGRYSGLVAELGGPDIAGVGFGLGVERLLLVLEAEDKQLTAPDPLDAYVVGIGTSAEVNTASLVVVQALRQQGYNAERDYLNKKPKAQFKTANKLGARYTVTIGEAELANHQVNVKDMVANQEITVPLATITNDFKGISAKF